MNVQYFVSRLWPSVINDCCSLGWVGIGLKRLQAAMSKSHFDSNSIGTLVPNGVGMVSDFSVDNQIVYNIEYYLALFYIF